MNSDFFRKYADIIQEAHVRALQEDAEGAPVSQAELTKLYKQGKPVHFVKETPVALLPFKQLEQMVGAKVAEQIKQVTGKVDKTSYDQAYKDKGYVGFQWDDKSNEPDFYIVPPNAFKSQYVKFTGQLPTDAKSRSKIPSLVVMQHMNIDPARIPFYVKIVPTEMVSVDDLGLADKTIQVNWGKQTVTAGGFLVREGDGHIYTVAPDAQGLPIGYVKAGITESTSPTNNPFDLPANDPFWKSITVSGKSMQGPDLKLKVYFRLPTKDYQSIELGDLKYQPQLLTGSLSIPNNKAKKKININITDKTHTLMKKARSAAERYKQAEIETAQLTAKLANYKPGPSDSSSWNR
jgi:hypothetical protein